jgi:hypothetical protein
MEMNGQPDVLLRTKVLYTEKRVKQIYDMMLKELENKRKQIQLLKQKAISILTTNDEVDEKQLGAPVKDLFDVTYEDVMKLTRQQLTAFVTVRKSKDSLVLIKMSKTKGTIFHATAGVECLLKTAKELAGREVIAEILQFETPTIPKALQVPEALKRVCKHIKIESWSPTAEWSQLVAQCIHPHSQQWQAPAMDDQNGAAE